MKRLAVLAVMLVAVAPARAEDFAALHARAVAAWEAQDYAAFRTAVAGALEVRPDYPPMLYNLALAEERLGRAGEALGLLQRLATMGLVVPADASTFPGLAGDPHFERVVAKLADNALPAGQSSTAVTVTGEVGFLPEGLAVDPASGDVFLGSVRQARILRIGGPDSEVQQFAGATPERLWGVFGMAVADGLLWVATSAVPETPDLPPAVRGRAAVNGYRLDDGELDFHCAWPEPAVFGDLLPEGRGAWVSDSTGGVYFLEPEGCRWATQVPPGVLVSPQGIAPGGKDELIVADYRGGLFRVAKAGGAPTRLELPANVTGYGIDGLYRAGDWLIAVQNGLAPHRVLALALSGDPPAVTGSRILASALPEFDEPTLGAVAGDHLLLVANAAWYRYGGTDLPPGGPPVILALPLPVAD